MRSEESYPFQRQWSFVKIVPFLLIIMLLSGVACGRRKLKSDEIKQTPYFAEVIRRESSRFLGEDGFFQKNLQSNPFPEVRTACALSLGRIGDKRALPWLYEALHYGDSSLREASAFSIGLIENRDRLASSSQSMDARTIPELLRLLDDSSVSVQMRAAEALGRTGSNAEAERLAERLNHLSYKRSPEERIYTDVLSTALARLKHPGGEVQLVLDSKANKDRNLNLPSQPYTESVCIALASYRFYPATATIETPQGNIEIELFRKDAPVGVAKFISLASKGAFQGLRFTQPVPFSFIGLEVPKIRTELDGTAACEINMHAFEKGSVGMTAGTNRIFITLAPAPDLDGMEPCIGRVISGMSVAEKIGSGDRIKKVQIKEYIGFLHVIRY